MNNELGESPLAGIMAATAEAMKAELSGIRASFDHAGIVWQGGSLAVIRTSPSTSDSKDA